MILVIHIWISVCIIWVGSGDPIKSAVNCFWPCWGQSWPFWLNFFCKMYQWYNWGSQKPTIGIDPYFWQTPSNVLITGLDEEEALIACDPYFWQTIHIFGRAPRVTKYGLPWPQNDFFHPFFFSSGSRSRHFCFAKKMHSFWSSIASRSLCRKKSRM